MKNTAIAALAVGVLGVGLLVTLLAKKLIGEGSFVQLSFVVALVSIVLLVLPRLRVLNLREAKLELDAFDRRVEEVKAKVAEMYGNINHLTGPAYVLDKAKQSELGLNLGAVVFSDAMIRYIAGVVSRERERLARIFIQDPTGEVIAKAIVDSSMNDKVFKWYGPETTLDMPPKSVAEREAEKLAKSATPPAPSE